MDVAPSEPNVVYAITANGLFAIAMIPETKAYFEKRRAGELKQISSLREFVTSHPAVRGNPAAPGATEPSSN